MLLSARVSYRVNFLCVHDICPSEALMVRTSTWAERQIIYFVCCDLECIAMVVSLFFFSRIVPRKKMLPQSTFSRDMMGVDYVT